MNMHEIPMVKINKTGALVIDDLFVLTPNGKMYVKPEKVNDDTFIQKVIKKDVSIVNSAIPKRNKVVPVGTEGALTTADNTEAFIKVPITELTDKDSYWTDEGLKSKNFTVDEKFIQAVIKKEVEIVGGTCPKVWKESAKGTLDENGKTYEEIKITKLTDKDKYKKEITVKSEE